MTQPTIIEPRDGYFVWTKKGHAPRFHHHTLESAQAEADRLARLMPGAKFIVMAGVSKHSVPALFPAGPGRSAGEGVSLPAGQEQGASE
jgi:hypothetical protein